MAMANARLASRTSRRLLLLMLTVVLPPAAALGGLGWQFIEQDQALIAQRELERREAAAQLVRRSLDLSLAETAQYLSDGPVPEGLVRIRVSPGSVEVTPDRGVLWVSRPDPGPEADAGVFSAAEALEYGPDAAGALRRYAELAASAQPAVRAGALVRVARVHLRLIRFGGRFSYAA